MTLQELFTQVKGKKRKHKPKIDELLNGDYLIIAEGMHDSGTVKVYENGYVLYTEYNHFTIFHVSDVYGKGMEYTTADEYAVPKKSRVIEADYFKDQDWLFRVVMEGNNRIQHNHNVKQNRYVAFRYSGIAEDIDELGYLPEYLVEDDFFQEKINEIKDLISPDLWIVYVSIKAYGITEESLARRLKITQQAVSKRYHKACKVIPEAKEKIKNKN